MRTMNRLSVTVAGLVLLMAAGTAGAAPSDNSAPVDPVSQDAAPARPVVQATPAGSTESATPAPSSGGSTGGGDTTDTPRPANAPLPPMVMPASAPANCSCNQPPVHHVRRPSHGPRDARLTRQLNEQALHRAPVAPPPTRIVSYTRIAAASQGTYMGELYPQPRIPAAPMMSAPADLSDGAAAAQGSGPSLPTPSEPPAAR